MKMKLGQMNGEKYKKTFPACFQLYCEEQKLKPRPFRRIEDRKNFGRKAIH